MIVPQQQIAQVGIPRVSVNLQRSAQAAYTGGQVQLSGAPGSAFPALVRWAQISGGQGFQSSITNEPGNTPWFSSDPNAGTMQGVIQNLDADAIEAAVLQVENREATSAPCLGWSVQVGATWAVDGVDRTPPAGGSLASPTMLQTPELAFPAPVAQGGTFRLHVAMGSGVWTAARTFGDVWPESQQVSAPNFNSGEILNSVPGNFVGIGPFPSTLYVKRPAGADPWDVWVWFGDSTIEPLRPIGSTNDTAKEGFLHFANAHCRAQGWKMRHYSRGQGGATRPETRARIRANLPYLVGKATRVVDNCWSWNGAPTSEAEADANHALDLELKAEVEAAGLLYLQVINHPYTTRNSAGQIAGFNRTKANVLAAGGIALDTIHGDSAHPNLPGTESEDNIHQNRTGAFRAGPLAAVVCRTRAQVEYPGI